MSIVYVNKDNFKLIKFNTIYFMQFHQQIFK